MSALWRFALCWLLLAFVPVVLCAWLGPLVATFYLLGFALTGAVCKEMKDRE